MHATKQCKKTPFSVTAAPRKRTFYVVLRCFQDFYTVLQAYNSFVVAFISSYRDTRYHLDLATEYRHRSDPASREYRYGPVPT